MNTQARIAQALESLTEAQLLDLLVYIDRLKERSLLEQEDPAWEAYLSSEAEREEVYQRLANA
jgi:hypothetical protein